MALTMRQVVLTDRSVLANKGTFERDLHVADPISALDVIVEATNGATSNQGVFLHDDVTQVQIVNGADVIHQLSLVQGIALNFWETGELPPQILTEAGGASQRAQYRIHFGRYLGDPEYWLAPLTARDLRIRVTTSLTLSATAGFATGTAKVTLTLVAHVFEEPPPTALGYLAAKEQDAWTTAANTTEEVVLPTDFPYRLIGLRLDATAAAWSALLASWQLALDGSALVPFDLDAEHLEMAGPRAWVSRRLFATDGDAVETLLGTPLEATADALTDLNLASVDAISATNATLQLLVVAATPSIAKSATDQPILLRAGGLLPLQTTAVALGDLGSDETWLDPQPYGLAVTRVAAGATGSAAASIFLQQVRPPRG